MQSYEYDLSGLMCPIPIIKAHRKINELAIGDILIVITTDPIARYDFVDYCHSTKHNLLKIDNFLTHMKVHIEKK